MLSIIRWLEAITTSQILLHLAHITLSQLYSNDHRWSHIGRIHYIALSSHSPCHDQVDCTSTNLLHHKGNLQTKQQTYLNLHRMRFRNLLICCCNPTETSACADRATSAKSTFYLMDKSEWGLKWLAGLERPIKTSIELAFNLPSANDIFGLCVCVCMLVLVLYSAVCLVLLASSKAINRVWRIELICV